MVEEPHSQSARGWTLEPRVRWPDEAPRRARQASQAAQAPWAASQKRWAFPTELEGL